MTTATPASTDEEYLAPVQARRVLGVTRRTFQRYQAAGLVVPAYRLPNGHARFARSHIEAVKRAAA